MILSRSQAIILMQMIEKVVEYIPGEGATCAICGNERTPTKHTDLPDWENLCQKRSHRCTCGHTFTSIEKMTHITKALKKAKYEGKKAKKR